MEGGERNLNTSHVILYQVGSGTSKAGIPEFKYISCYSLSILGK